jgi:hypothetical protein
MLDQPVGALYAQLAGVALSGGGVPAPVGRQIADNVETVERRDRPTIDVLFRASETAGALTVMLQIGKDAVRTGRVERLDALRRVLAEFRSGVEILCAAGPRRLRQLNLPMPSDTPADGVPDIYASGDIVPPSVLNKRMASLVALAVALSCALILVQRAVQFVARTFLFWHACLIRGRLELGDAVIHGHILGLSRTRCRFRPHDPLDAYRLAMLAPAEATRLMVRDICVPLNVRWAHDGEVGCAFELPLPGGLHIEMLERSTLSPQPMEPTWQESNVARRFSTRSTLAHRLQPEGAAEAGVSVRAG